MSKLSDVDFETPLAKVPVEVTVSVGQARLSVRELLESEANTVITLDKRLDDPVDLIVGGKLIARGILEAQGDNNDRISVRLTEVVNLNSTL